MGDCLCEISCFSASIARSRVRSGNADARTSGVGILSIARKANQLRCIDCGNLPMQGAEDQGWFKGELASGNKGCVLPLSAHPFRSSEDGPGAGLVCTGTVPLLRPSERKSLAQSDVGRSACQLKYLE